MSGVIDLRAMPQVKRERKTRRRHSCRVTRVFLSVARGVIVRFIVSGGLHI